GQQQTTQAEDWRDAIIDLSTVTLTSNVIRVRLRSVKAGVTTGDISIDDFRVDNIPTCPNITGLTNGAINSNSVELNWIAGGAEAEWVVEYRLVGATAFTTVTPNPTATTATVTGLNSATEYEFCVRAVCAANDISQQTCINRTTTPDYCAGDTFVDSGGISGDYQNNENITYNICPDNAGDVVYINFTFNDMEDSTAGCFDGLTIYDGPDTTFPTINTPTGGTEWCWDPVNNTGTGNLVGELLIGTSTSGCITLVFSSDGSVQRPGWAATVTCAPPPTCLSPTALDVTSATDTTASLAWTAGGTETAWDVEVGLPGFAPNTAATVIPVVNVMTNPSTTVTGLTADTTYEYYVRAICGPGDESIYIGPFTFKTECAPLTAPYIEDFETFTANLLFTEQNCWKANSNSTTFTAWDWNLDIAGGTPTANTGPDAAFNGTNYFYIEGNGGAAGNEANLLSPLVNVSVLTNPSLQFRYHMFGAATGILHVDINDGTGFVNDVVVISGQQQSSGAAPWELVVVDLSTFAPGSIQARFRAERTETATTGTSDIAIDNVVFDEAPACAEPSILTASNITDVSANLTWNENGSATSWIVEYGPCGFVPGTMAAGAVTVTATTNTGLSISGLSSATCYEFYVTADCGMGTLSNVTGPSRFSTALTGPVGVTCTTGNPYFIWTEGFNTIATNWTGDVGTGITNGDWNFGRATAPGSIGTGPSGPFEGNGFLYFETSGTNVGPARVVSPPIDLTGSVNDELELSFYYHAFGGDATIVSVEYGTSPTGPWTQVFTYTGQIQTSATQPFQAVGAMLPSTLIGQIIYIRISGTEAPGGEAGFVGDIAIDQMRIETCGTFCEPPLVISAGATTDTTATINWTSPASVTAWEYVNQPAGTGLPTAAGTPVMAATAMISGLTAATDYEFYVRSDCGGGFFSTWVGPFNYSTECASFSAPYTTGFENFAITTNFVEDNCWTTPQTGAVFSWDTRTGTTPSTATGPTAAATGTNYFYTEASVGAAGAVAELVSPLVNLAGFTSPTLTFNYHMFGADITALSIDVNDGTAWTNDVFVLTGQQQTANADAWRNASVPLAAFTGNTIQVRFRVIRGASFDGDVAIDDIVIDGTAGIDSLDSLGFTYYPNPTKDIVQFNGVQPIDTISVRNMLGQVIETLKVDSLNTQISLANYAAGIYLVEVRTAGRTGVVRIIKE
ncbi:MAG: fibronectin type III domain-containing protein, partial [Nonlabens sp.]|nr:fibronectin type III domain-containing protein [Nonlabens sp.]